MAFVFVSVLRWQEQVNKAVKLQEEVEKMLGNKVECSSENNIVHITIKGQPTDKSIFKVTCRVMGLQPPYDVETLSDDDKSITCNQLHGVVEVIDHIKAQLIASNKTM